MTVDRVIIAAPASGSGKTTVATGLMAALVAKGCRVAPFKVGPDYIDPGYHAVATGLPGRNLDPVLVGEDRIRGLFAHGVRGADVAIVEGVMGLFDGRAPSVGARSGAGGSGLGDPAGPEIRGVRGDGEFGSDRGRDLESEFDSDFGPDLGAGSALGPDRGPSFGRGFGSDFGSTAHVARLLEAPIVLVVDARGQGRSLAALLHGFRGYDPTVRLAGVVLNQVGSARHEQVLGEACAEIGLPVLGAVPRGAEVEVPSRHLGLIPAVEHGEPARRAVAAMGELIARSVDLAAVRRVAASAGRPTWQPWDAETEIARALAADPPLAQSALATHVGIEVTRVGDSGPLGVAAAGADGGGEAAASRAGTSGPGACGVAAAGGGGVGGGGVGAGEVGGRGVGVGGASAGGAGDGAGDGGSSGADFGAGGDGGGGVGGAGVERVGGSVAGGGSRVVGFSGVRPVVAVAGGAAFTFGYAEYVELLLAAGADVVVVDPLRDDGLPDRTAALVLPGGFPERHSASLSANPTLRRNVALFARSGGILQAECGGLLYLLDELCGEPMCGVLRGSAAMAPRLTLGYRDAVVAADSVCHRAGERVAGHEFHRTVVIDSVTNPAWYWRDHDGHPVREGFVQQNVHASYLHTHPAGQPETVARLVAAARKASS